jgi:hypothetical protein
MRSTYNKRFEGLTAANMTILYKLCTSHLSPIYGNMFLLSVGFNLNPYDIIIQKNNTVHRKRYSRVYFLRYNKITVLLQGQDV